MKLIGMIFLACIILSVLQVALSVLVVAGMLLLIVGVFYRPAETFGLLLFGAFSTFLQTHPVGCIWLLSLALFFAIIKRPRNAIKGTSAVASLPDCAKRLRTLKP